MHFCKLIFLKPTTEDVSNWSNTGNISIQVGRLRANMAAFEGSEGLGIEGLAPCQRVTLFFAESFGMAGHGRVSWLDVQFHWFFWGVKSIDWNTFLDMVLIPVARPMLVRKLKGPFNDVFGYTISIMYLP